MNAPVVAGTVQLGKPAWQSKKVWLAVLGLAAALITAYTGKPETTEQLVTLVTKVASIVGIIAPLILSIAHVDGKERDLALALISTGKTLGDPEATPVVAVHGDPLPSSTTSSSAPKPFDFVPGLDRK